MKDCGVYVLYSGDVPVYVGSSVRMSKRVSGHSHKGKFSRVEYSYFPENLLTKMEQEFIDRLKPSLNKLPARRKAECAELSCTTISFTARDLKNIEQIKARENIQATTAVLRWALNEALK
jgi:hypothetical protein